MALLENSDYLSHFKSGSQKALFYFNEFFPPFSPRVGWCSDANFHLGKSKFIKIIHEGLRINYEKVEINFRLIVRNINESTRL